MPQRAGQPGRLFLIDGTSYGYRAFYAIRELRTSAGLPTNAVYGFLMMLRRLLDTECPEYLAVAFDMKAPTFRHQQSKEYKASRKPMPEPLVGQLGMIRELLAAYRIPAYEYPGYEADDILGTLAQQASGAGLMTYLVTADKDALQLVGPMVHVYRLEGDHPVVIDEAQVEAKWGVPASRLPDVMALAGDDTDDIKGVPGIGPKRAVELVVQHGSLDRMLARLDAVEPVERRQTLQEHLEHIALNRLLVTVRTDAPVTLDLEAMQRRPPDDSRLYTLFRQWEFKRLVKAVAPAPSRTAAWHRVGDAAAADEVVTAARRVGTIAIYPVWQEAMRLGGCAIGVGETLVYADWAVPEVVSRLAPALADPGLAKVSHDLKALRLGLRRMSLDLRGDVFDAMVAAYLVEPSKGSYPIEELTLDCAGHVMPPPAPEAAEPAIQAVQQLPRVREALAHALETQGLMPLYRDIEHPLIEVLAGMEFAGVAIDVAVLHALSSELAKSLDRLTTEIHEIAGRAFNINSPKQLQEILFKELKLPVIKRTKTGASTDEDVLQRLATMHALPATMVKYRALAKLQSTYVDALPALVSPETGRIHASFNQTVTATGRLSSSNPNLQNIPIRTDIGRQIRRAFISRWPAGCLLAADYSQIELRVLAHLSGDEVLSEAFRRGQDIHRVTAADVFHVAPEQVTDAQRAVAKTINFGIIYGMTPYGLSKELGVDVGEAERFITKYFERYPKVKEYLDRSLAEARRLGYCSTLCQRRRYIPQLNADHPQVRQFAERTAINAPIQGSAADLIKVAMIRIHRALAERGLKTVMVLQVHDELVFDVPAGELDTVRPLVTELMTSSTVLAVPIQVHVTAGRNWLEATH